MSYLEKIRFSRGASLYSADERSRLLEEKGEGGEHDTYSLTRKGRGFPDVESWVQQIFTEWSQKKTSREKHLRRRAWDCADKSGGEKVSGERIPIIEI